jgi:hypothetical protein
MEKNIDVVIVAYKNGLFTIEQFKVAVMLWKEGIPTLLYDKNIHGTIVNLAKDCEKHGVRFVVFVESPGDSCEVFDSKDISTSNIEHPHLIASYLKQRCVSVTPGSLSNISEFKQLRLFDLTPPRKDSKEIFKTISQLPAREPICSSEHEFASITSRHQSRKVRITTKTLAPKLGGSEPLSRFKSENKQLLDSKQRNEQLF